MHESHAKAFDCPDRKEKLGEGKLSVCPCDVVGRCNKAHDNQSEEGNGKPAGNRPLPADFVGNGTCSCKTDDAGKPADDGENHGGAGNRLEIIDNVIADIGSDGII